MSLNDSLQFTGGASQLAKLGAPKSRPLVDIIISSLYPLILRSTVFSPNLCELPEALSRISSIFLCFLFLFSLLFFPACSFPSPRFTPSTLLLLAAFPQAGNIGDILKSSRIVCSNTYQPEVERSIEPGQTQKAFGTDIPVSNATGNGRSFRAMMRPDTHILVNIFNRVSDRRDVREIRSRVYDRTNRPTRHFHPTITSWRDVPMCVFQCKFYINQTDLPLPLLSPSWYIIE